jgi:hypothetical protein
MVTKRKGVRRIMMNTRIIGIRYFCICGNILSCEDLNTSPPPTLFFFFSDGASSFLSNIKRRCSVSKKKNNSAAAVKNNNKSSNKQPLAPIKNETNINACFICGKTEARCKCSPTMKKKMSTRSFSEVRKSNNV